MPMDIEHHTRPVLIYFKTRGIAQIIREVLLEIGVEFQEIFVSSSGYLDPAIVQKYQIDLKGLPYLVHENFVMNGVFPIIKYCCFKFERTDLLGTNIHDCIHIAEIMVKEMRQKGVVLHTLFNGLKEIKEKNLGEEGLKALNKRMLTAVMSNNISLCSAEEMLKLGKKYVFGYLTVLDFALYEKAFYYKNTHVNQGEEVIKALEGYAQMFESTEFYKKHHERLSIYKVLLPEADEIINELIRKMWKGDPTYIAY